jgi:hypothetical protein
MKKKPIRRLSNVSIQEKIEYFDKCFINALNEFNEFCEDRSGDEYRYYCAWENYITIIANSNDKFWKYWNGI